QCSRNGYFRGLVPVAARLDYSSHAQWLRGIPGKTYRPRAALECASAGWRTKEGEKGTLPGSSPGLHRCQGWVRCYHAGDPVGCPVGQLIFEENTDRG